MPILIALIGLALPRLAIFLIWLFSHWFSSVFNGWLIPLLGFIFLPYTLLWYAAVTNWFGGSWGFWQIAIMALAVLIDFSSALKSRS